MIDKFKRYWAIARRPSVHYSLGFLSLGGFAMGLDRLVALTAGLDNIRDVIAFPKTTSATDLMCQAPSRVRPQQLDEIHIQLAGRALRQEEDAPASKSS